MTNTDRTPAALMTSLALHALVVVIVLLFTYSATFRSKEAPKIFELVAGEGTNYMATEAPKLGTPGGVKVTVPAPVVPKAEPVVAPEPTPVKPEPAPIKAETPPAPPPTPTKAATKAPATPAPRTPAQEIRRLMANADKRAKKEVAKQRDEDAKRAVAMAKVQHIDGAGIAKGVVDGSTANKDSGAGGKALTSSEGSQMERFESALMAALRAALEKEKPDGLSESLVASVQFRIEADGSLSNVRFAKGSGSTEFDNAVRAAIRRVSATIKPPAGMKSEVVELDFRAKEDGE